MRRNRTNDQKLVSLQEVPALRGCSLAELRELGRVTDQHEYAAGAVLATEGRPGRQAWLIIEGAVDVSCAGSSRWTARPGNLIGDLGFAGVAPAPATLTALTPLRVFSFSPRAAETLLRVPGAARWVLSEQERRLRDVIGAPTTYHVSGAVAPDGAVPALV